MANYRGVAGSRVGRDQQQPQQSGNRKEGVGATAVNGVGRLTGAAIGAADRASANTPFLGQEGKQIAQTTGGATQLTLGILGGNKRNIKEGASRLGKGVWDTLTAAPLRSLNNPPPQQFLGGSADALAQRQGMYMDGIAQGNALMGAGVGTADAGVGLLGQAAGQSIQDRQFGYGLAGTGYMQQGAALGNARALAGQSTDSMAQLQMQQGLAQAQQAMMGQAAQARGGNQAAAMRGAQLAAANMALQTNGQAAMLRAAEQQAMINRQMGVEQLAAQMGGQQLGLGLGAAQQGTSQLGQFGGQVGSIGLGQGQIGLGSQGQYVGALAGTDKEQLEADTQHASAAQASKGGVMGVAGKIIGGILGS